MEKVIVFVDGWNLAVGFKDYLKDLGHGVDEYKIDFRLLPMELAGQDRRLAYTHYYIGAVSQQDDPERYSAEQRFFSALRQIPRFGIHEGRLAPRTRELVCPRCQEPFEWTFRLEKGADVQIATDILMGAFLDEYETAIIVTNDTDFIHVVKQVQQLRKRVQNAEFENRIQDSRLARECDPPCIVLDKVFLANCVFGRYGHPVEL